MFVSITRPGSSERDPGAMPRRRTCPTPSANSRFAGITRNASAPTRSPTSAQCFAREYPCGTLSVVQSR